MGDWAFLRHSQLIYRYLCTRTHIGLSLLSDIFVQNIPLVHRLMEYTACSNVAN